MEFDPDCESTKGVLLDQIELAESTKPQEEEEEIWKLVNSDERVKEKYAESVARAFSEIIPGKTKEMFTIKYFEEVLEEDLCTSVRKIVNRLVPKKPIHKPYQQHPHHKVSLHGVKPGLQKRPAEIKPSDEVPAIKSASIAAPFISEDSQKPVRKPKSKKGNQPELTITDDESTDSPLSTKLPSRIHESAAVSYEESLAIRERVRNPKKKRDDLTLHTIDFAGQLLYRPMHHCFITNRAVYLVVFKLTEVLKYIQPSTSNTPLSSKNPISEIRYWLNNIIAHGTDPDADDEADCPRIFLVGTHKNGDPRNGVPALTSDDLQIVNEHLSKIFLKDIKEKRYEGSIQCNKENGGSVVFALENSLTKQERLQSGITPLMKHVRNLRSEIPFLAKEFPTSYIKLEKKLFEMKEERKDQPLATKKEVEDWAKKCGIDEDGIHIAIQFFHDIRVVVDQCKFQYAACMINSILLIMIFYNSSYI